MKITESINENSRDIDLKSTVEILKIINDEDKKVAFAVEKALPEIEKAVDMLVTIVKNNGRIFYIGAGTSGRLGIVDAAECPPTFGVSHKMFQGIIAGGRSSVFKAREFCEDKEQMGATDLARHSFNSKDALVGLSCSGSTPYVLGALKKAKSIGASSIVIMCNPEGTLSEYADVTIRVITGPEVLTGSTRMKAGTGEKMVLNMLSTATMIRTGRVSGNMMADMQISCKKLENRAVQMIVATTGVSPEKANELISKNNGNLRTAMEEAKCRN
ncbi:MAG: N-acetylmuramic acid 6-phosphate etherase [Lentisphaerae bacterium GWF2_44_16]|nr:MAG: N-acetylmuramic acid 6-phosphate etherase [Lentisphaerae bacterium GWF2_44_16]